MAENTKITDQQKQIENARLIVRTAQTTIKQIQLELKTLIPKRGSIDGPLDSETKNILFRRIDDALDDLDNSNSELAQQYNIYNTLEKVKDYPKLSSDLRISKSELSNTTSDLKIAKEKLKVAIENEEALRLLLNQDLTEAISNRVEQESNVSELLVNFNQLLVSHELLLVDFSKINDPRYLVSNVNDRSPFLLLPIRVETRYMTIKHVRRISRAQGANLPIADKKELWLRFFPDDISNTTHEDCLTADEQTAAHSYWNKIWNPNQSINPSPNLSPDEIKSLEFGAWRLIVDGFGAERAAWIVKQTEPTNILIDPRPVTAVFPLLDIKPQSWNESPKTHVLPDRFVVRLYTDDTNYREVLGKTIPDPLVVGLSPDHDSDGDFIQENGEIAFPEEIKWMSDFNEAKEVGMGLSIPLEENEKLGIKRILVLGLKLSANTTESTKLFENLIEGHHYTTGGFSFVAQGTPTNNTENSKSGFSKLSSQAEDSFDNERSGDLFTTTTNYADKKDGQWFSDMLGINPSVIQNVNHANGTDTCEAIAMNKALWPATMGYYLKQMLHPHVNLSDQVNAKKFFTQFVTGRGKIPTFRVKDQPYGIIPSTVYSRWKYDKSNATKFYDKLNTQILQPMNTVWSGFADDYVKSVSTDNSVDPSERLMDILGLHSSSVEFHQRYANGTHQMWNIWRYINESGQTSGIDFPELNGDEITDFLASYNSQLTMTMAAPPKIFELNFLTTQRLLNGPVVDGFKQLPYSEIRGIQPFPDTEWNYIHWLLEDTTTITRVREELYDNLSGVLETQTPPKALLYLLLRHAYLLEYVDTSTGILIEHNVVNQEAQLEVEMQAIGEQGLITEEEKSIIFKAVTEELTLETKALIKITVAQEFENSRDVTPRHIIRSRENELYETSSETLTAQITAKTTERINNYKSDQKKWNYLTEPIQEVSGRDTMEMHIQALLSANHGSTDALAALKNSLLKLKDLPTARLERAFAEHLDLCNYRLDAWMIGLVNQRLEEQQSLNQGINLGAFGIIENLKPSITAPGVHVVEVDNDGNELSTSPEITTEYTYIGDDNTSILERDLSSGKVRALPTVDESNQGFIHTPSINHAVTAAILRAGYISHQKSTSADDTLAVNLTSKRMRRALFYLEGIQNNQTLPALLGYRFERELHDKSGVFYNGTVNNLDQYILDIRLIYPLTAGSVEVNTGVSIETQEASNVTDALALINAYEDDYTILDSITNLTMHKTEIIKAVDQIRDDMDAIADLLLSESVYQMTKGNMERSSAVLKAISSGGTVQTPEILKTPRQGAVLTQRFGVQFITETGALPDLWTINGTPKSITEPHLNGWLAQQIPIEKLRIKVSYDGTASIVSFSDLIGGTLAADNQHLNMEAIDFVYLVGDNGDEKDASGLSARILNYLSTQHINFDESKVEISYLDNTGIGSGNLSFVQMLPLIRELKKLIGNSKPITSIDYKLPGDSVSEMNATITIDDSPTLTRFKKLIGTTPINISTLLAVTSLNTTDFTAIGLSVGKTLDNYLIELQKAIYKITITTLTSNDFIIAETDLKNKLIEASFYSIPNTIVSTTFESNEVARDELVKIANKVLQVILTRRTKTIEILDTLEVTMKTKELNHTLTNIAEIVFGRAFKIYPEFKINNYIDVNLSRTNSNLLGDNPMVIEEWLQTSAKVKTKMTNYQKIRLFSDSLTGKIGSDLNVIQLPVVDNTTDRWVGMTLDADHKLSGDTLSLVMELPDSFNSSTAVNYQAGLIVDEWIETIPDENIHTGIAMNYNQPNTEAPNSIIMAVTPEITGAWEWDDLMDTLNETLSLARKRAIEPDHIKEEIWGQVLPALVSSISPNDSTPSVDFGRNVTSVQKGQFGHLIMENLNK